MNETDVKKNKVSLYLLDDTYMEVKNSFRKDNCDSYNEFMERAIKYYLGYVNSGHMTDYLSPTIMSSVKAASDENTTRITRILFKLAVEIAVMNNIIAASFNIDDDQVRALRRECEKVVKKMSGDFNLNDAIYWQRK